jgi:hypothetical protein
METEAKFMIKGRPITESGGRILTPIKTNAPTSVRTVEVETPIGETYVNVEVVPTSA